MKEELQQKYDLYPNFIVNAKHQKQN